MIPYAEPVYFGNEEKYVLDAVNSKWISGGDYVNKFETQLSDYLGRITITTSNGTSALELAYLSILGNANRSLCNVVVPAFGFMAAANVAKNLGLDVRFADVDKYTWLIDTNKVKELVDDNTLAIVAIHSYGNVCNIEDIKYQVKDHCCAFVIEDCAESLFSRSNDKEAGTLGDISTFSFHATKTITTGEGGAFATDNLNILRAAKLIKNHGLAERGNYNHTTYGMNFRMSNLNAALGVAQFENKYQVYTKKRNLNDMYLDRLWMNSDIEFQLVDDSCVPCMWATAIKLGESYPSNDKIVEAMKNAGVEIRPGFISPNYLNLFGNKHIDTPIADELSRRVISLPCSMALDENDVRYICDTLLRLRK